MTIPTVQTQRNGERGAGRCPAPSSPDQPLGSHPIHPDVAEALKPPTTGTRAARFQRASVRICTWPSDYPGLDRWAALRRTVERVRAEVDVDEKDLACLIARALPMNGKTPYTLEELRAAVRGGANPNAPPAIKSGGLAPQASPGLPPSMLDRLVERDRAAKAEPEELVGITADQVVQRKLDWFLYPYIAKGYYTMVAGRQGSGKSTFFTGMAARARRTVWLCGEEGLDNLVVPRQRAHGIADHQVEYFTRDNRLAFPHCKDALRRRIDSTRADLVIIDPLTAFIGHNAETNSNECMLPVLDSLDDLARQTGATVLVCLHPGKAQNNTIRGASVFMTHPRVVLELVKNAGPPAKRMITNPKGNLIGEQGAIEFFADRDADGVGIFRLGEAMDQAEAQFATEVPDRIERLVVQECEDWLKGMLGEGDKPRKQLVGMAKDEGYSPRTLERAADKLGVIRERGNFRAGEGSIWRLPPHLQDTSTPFDGPAPIPE